MHDDDDRQIRPERGGSFANVPDVLCEVNPLGVAVLAPHLLDLLVNHRGVERINHDGFDVGAFLADSHQNAADLTEVTGLEEVLALGVILLTPAAP